MKISFGWRHAGLVTVWGGRGAVHVIPRCHSWLIGYRDDGEYDGLTLHAFGLGPILLVTWMGK